MLNTEQVVYIARKLKWNRSEIGKLKPLQAVELYNELVYQESLEEYKWNYFVALIIASIANTVPRKSGRVYQARDFLNCEEPKRMGERNDKSEILAESKGIILPKENDD